jgi:hypothetical protein
MSNQTILITNYRINNPSQTLFDTFSRCGKIVSFQLNEGKEKADAVITYENPFSAEIAMLLDYAALGPQGEKIRVRSKGKTWNPESSGFQEVDISNRAVEQQLIPSAFVSNIQSLGHKLKDNVEEAAKQLDSRIETSEFKENGGQDTYSTAKEAIKNTIQAIGNVSRETYATASDVAKRAGEVVIDAGDLVKTKSQETLEMAKYMYDNIKNTGQEATQAASDVVTNIFTTGKDTLVDATHMATDAIHTTTDTVSELVHNATDTGKAALSSATGVVVNTGSAVGEAIKSTGNAVVSGGIVALEVTGNALKNAGEVVFSTGEKIVELVQGNEEVEATKTSM